VSKLDVLKDYSKRGAYDEIWTPKEALIPLLPYIPKNARVWDCAPGSGKLIEHFKDSGIATVYCVGNHDFLTDSMSWRFDVIVTNPPFSKKHLFLKRACEYKKPWALLLPVTTLGVRRCQKYLDDVKVLFLPKRIDFTGGKAPWFSVAWFTYGLGLDKQINFVV
jgi:hypothetical protein